MSVFSRDGLQKVERILNKRNESMAMKGTSLKFPFNIIDIYIWIADYHPQLIVNIDL